MWWIVPQASVGSPPNFRPSGTWQAGRVFRSPFSACLEGGDPECIASPSPRVKKFGNGHRLPEERNSSTWQQRGSWWTPFGLYPA